MPLLPVMLLAHLLLSESTTGHDLFEMKTSEQIYQTREDYQSNTMPGLNTNPFQLSLSTFILLWGSTIIQLD